MGPTVAIYSKMAPKQLKITSSRPEVFCPEGPKK